MNDTLTSITATIGRRKFITVGAVGAAAAVAGTQLSRASAPAAAGPLVIVFLRGGADALSLVAPANDPAYKAARPTLAIKPAATTQIADWAFLHPNLAGVTKLPNLGVLWGVGEAGDPTRSHFEQQARVERGSRDRAIYTGWVTRHITKRGVSADKFQVVSVGGGTAPAASAGLTSQIAVPATGTLTPATPDILAIWKKVNQMNQPDAYSTGLRALLQTADRITDLNQKAGTPAAAYPAGQFGERLSRAAALIKHSPVTEVILVDLEGWDTHDTMGVPGSGGAMDRLVKQLNDALVAFVGDIGSHIGRTTVLVHSEFGRQLNQNASGGFDHGEGGVLFAFGAGVKAGVHGRPDLTPGGLRWDAPKVTTRIADVYWDALAARGNTGASVFTGLPSGHIKTPIF